MRDIEHRGFDGNRFRYTITWYVAARTTLSEYQHAMRQMNELQRPSEFWSLTPEESVLAVLFIAAAIEAGWE